MKHSTSARPSKSPPPGLFHRPLALAVIAVLTAGLGTGIGYLLAGGLLFGGRPAGAGDPSPATRELADRDQRVVSDLKLSEIPFNGARAYESLQRLVDIGPRRSGSEGMKAQQKLLSDYFQQRGGKVEFQRFTAPDPRDGATVPMANLVVHWNPTAVDRVLLCAHYDTLPFPLRDRQNPHGRFVGANDNASGVAILMEMANDLPKLHGKYGVDFLLVDGEEYIFRENEPMFLGAKYFARQYARQLAAHRLAYRYHWGILLDMVGAADLRIGQEGNSVRWRNTWPLLAEIWSTAARLGVREFVAEVADPILDDHLCLHDVAHIPCIDLIDFDYPPWHTQGDTADKCSALSLAKVGWVLEEWLKKAK
jgi:hypothetical protein